LNKQKTKPKNVISDINRVAIYVLSILFCARQKGIKKIQSGRLAGFTEEVEGLSRADEKLFKGGGRVSVPEAKRFYAYLTRRPVQR